MGPSEPECTIRVNGKKFKVRHNLYHFLLQMKWRQSTDAFFVDAICIDQEDDVEKTLRVQQMRRIYGEAQRVYFWLGPSQDDINSICKRQFPSQSSGINSSEPYETSTDMFPDRGT